MAFARHERPERPHAVLAGHGFTFERLPEAKPRSFDSSPSTLADHYFETVALVVCFDEGRTIAGTKTRNTSATILRYPIVDWPEVQGEIRLHTNNIPDRFYLTIGPAGISREWYIKPLDF